MAMLDNLKIPKYSADFKVKLLRVAQLRSRAKEMFIGEGKEEMKNHMDGMLKRKIWRMKMKEHSLTCWVYYLNT